MRKTARVQHFARNSLCGCLRAAKDNLQEAATWAGRLNGQKRLTRRLVQRSISLGIELIGLDSLGARLMHLANEIDGDLQKAVGIPVLPEEKAAAKKARKIRMAKQ